MSPRLSRLFSLSGIVPLGVFVVAHVAVNASAVRGPEAFIGVVTALHRMPAFAWIEWLLILAPLGLHAAVGVWMTTTGRTLETPRPYAPATSRAIRATGVVALLFVLTHLPELRFASGSGRLGASELATLLDRDLSSTWHGLPWRGLWYLAGTAAVVFHLFVGLWGVIASPPRNLSGRAPRWALAVAGVALWLAAADVVVLRATGAAIVGDPGSHAADGSDCSGK